MSFLQLDESLAERIKEYLGGDLALPNSYRDYGDTPEEAVEAIRTEAKALLKKANGSGEESTIFNKRKAAVFFALARDLDRGMAGDRTLRGHGFSEKLRTAYETVRGAVDHEEL